MPDLRPVDELPPDPPDPPDWETGPDVFAHSARPKLTKFTAKKKRQYLEHLRRGMRRGAAAEAVGVSRWTVNNHRKADPIFATFEAQAEDDANEVVEDALFQAASSGNVVAALAWLFNRAPDRWKDKRNVAHTGADGGPIKVETQDVIDREIERLMAEVSARSQATPTPQPLAE